MGLGPEGRRSKRLSTERSLFPLHRQAPGGALAYGRLRRSLASPPPWRYCRVNPPGEGVSGAEVSVRGRATSGFDLGTTGLRPPGQGARDATNPGFEGPSPACGHGSCTKNGVGRQMASGDRRVGGLELRLSGSAVDVLRGGCATWVPAS